MKQPAEKQLLFAVHSPLGSGMEHITRAAFFVRDKVMKALHPFGRFWRGVEDSQEEGKDAIEDLRILKKYEMPIPETEIHVGDAQGVELVTIQEYRGFFARLFRPFIKISKVPYVMVQTLLTGMEGVLMADMETEVIRKQVVDIYEKACTIFKEENRGTDIVGMSALIDLLKGKEPSVTNLETVDKKVLLTDLRLFNFAKLKGWRYDMLLFFFQLEQEALRLLLHDFGEENVTDLQVAGTPKYMAKLLYAMTRVRAALGEKLKRATGSPVWKSVERIF